MPRDPLTRLRLAVPADEAFLRQLYKTTRAAEFVAAGLPAAALEGLLDQQYRAQTVGYGMQFPDACSLIVEHRDAPAGRLLLLCADHRWHIVDIALLPAVRGQGIGTDLIEAIARAAAARGARELTLAVLSGSAAARRLYARLGFSETGGDVHLSMVRRLGG